MAKGRIYQRGKDGKELPKRSRWGAGTPHIQFTVNGKRIRKRVDARTRGEAEVILAEEISRAYRDAKKRPPGRSSHAIGALMLRWKKEEGRKKQDFDRAMRIAEFVGLETKIDDITPVDIGNWLDQRRSCVGGTTVKRDLTPLSAFFTWAVGRGFTLYNPARDVPKGKGRGKSPSPIPHAELADVLSAVRGHYLEPAVMLAYWAGLRLGEIVKIQKSHIHNGVLMVPGTKRERSFARIPIVGPLALYLDRHEWAGEYMVTSIRHTGQPVKESSLQSARNRWNASAQKVRAMGGHAVDLPNWHRFRHTIGLKLVMDGQPVHVVASFLRNTIKMVEQVYGNYTAMTFADQLSSIK